jgi:hypothetical protein
MTPFTAHHLAVVTDAKRAGQPLTSGPLYIHHDLQQRKLQ